MALQRASTKRYTMSDINTKRSYSEVLVGGTPTSTFNIGFEYTEKVDHINAKVDNKPANTAGYTYTITSPNTVTFSPAVPSGSLVRLERETNIDNNLHKFTAGAEFNAAHMDANFAQIRNSQQEVKDAFTELAELTYNTIDGLDEALATAQQNATAATLAQQDAAASASIANASATSAVNAQAAMNNSLSTTESERLPYWYAKVGGFSVNQHLRLTNGILVRSTIDANTTNPNVAMTGWTYLDTASNGLTVSARNSTVPTIMDYFTESELNTFKSNPSMDCTAIIRRAFATGAKRINFLDLQLHITLSSTIDDPLAVFNTGDIELLGNGAAFIDDTVYASTVASFNPLFVLTGSVTSFKSNIAHIGLQIPSMSTQIGYRGATYVYSKGANKNITLNTYLENTRYGILAGSYSDPSLGGAKHLRFDLDCKNVGYPIATYLADDIEGEIRGAGFHRVHYIAGCNHARIQTLVKNYYIAPIAHLYSDAMTSVGVSKGCTDCETEAIDTGSTQYVSNGYLLGISPSRVDPNTVYDSVKLTGSLVGKTGQCEKLGLATIVSSVRTVQPSYPANWESSIYLNNITINGQINRRAQTTAEHDFSDVYLSCLDNASISGEDHFPTIRNLSVNVDYFAGSGTKPRGFWWFLNGLQDKANIRLYAPNSGQNVIRSNTTSLIKFHDSSVVGVDFNSSASLNSNMEFIDSFISDAAQLPTVNKRFVNTPIAGVYPSGTTITTVSNTLSLSGASVSWANALPNNALILSVSFVITTAITGASGLLVGVSGTLAKYFSSPLVAAGSGLSNANATANSLPHNQVGTGSLLITARDSGGGTAASFTGGAVKVVLNYILFPVPTL